MQCPSCRCALPSGQDVCPDCQKTVVLESVETEYVHDPVLPSSATSSLGENRENSTGVSSQPRGRSTLIEFPGSGKGSKSRPQWRQDLSARVREIQEKKAREGTEASDPNADFSAPGVIGTQLGLVAQPEPTDVNPIVAAALKRIERAHQPTMGLGRKGGTRGGGAAVARATEDEYEVNPSLSSGSIIETAEHAPSLVEDTLDPPFIPEPVREPKLAIVSSRPAEIKVDEEPKTEPRRAIAGVIDDDYLARLEEHLLPSVKVSDPFDNYARLSSRVAAGVVDLFIIGFGVSPFAAIIELTNGNWSDVRVLSTLAGIFLLAIFLYEAGSTALSGRTIGMSYFSLRAINGRTGQHPSTIQSIIRAIGFIVVIVSGFVGIFTALFDGERRALHDLLSRTVVVRD
jgi:uncharacterized RDD family membrane protein YckC